jgi:hypothetical protein
MDKTPRDTSPDQAIREQLDSARQALDTYRAWECPKPKDPKCLLADAVGQIERAVSALADRMGVADRA